PPISIMPNRLTSARRGVAAASSQKPASAASRLSSYRCVGVPGRLAHLFDALRRWHPDATVTRLSSHRSACPYDICHTTHPPTVLGRKRFCEGSRPKKKPRCRRGLATQWYYLLFAGPFTLAPQSHCDTVELDRGGSNLPRLHSL